MRLQQPSGRRPRQIKESKERTEMGPRHAVTIGGVSSYNRSGRNCGAAAVAEWSVLWVYCTAASSSLLVHCVGQSGDLSRLTLRTTPRYCRRRRPVLCALLGRRPSKTESFGPKKRGAGGIGGVLVAPYDTPGRTSIINKLWPMEQSRGFQLRH